MQGQVELVFHSCEVCQKTLTNYTGVDVNLLNSDTAKREISFPRVMS